MAKEEELRLNVDTNIKGVVKDQKAWNKELDKTKENLEDVNEEGKETIAEMQILGISLNGVKAGFSSLAKGAKFLFSTIRIGIASTGIGLLVLAFSSLAVMFSKTKKGAEAISVVFAGIGAAVKVLIDRVSDFGGGLAKVLSGNIRGGLKDMKNSFKDIGKEILIDTILIMGLTSANQKLSDSQRKLNVETAQRRADIEELKLIAEDTTKSEKVRLKAAQDAFDIENDLLIRNISNAKEAVRLETLRHSTIKAMDEDLDKLAQLEIDLANIRGESTTKQIELNNKINAIKQETINKNIEIKTQNDQIVKDTKDMLIELELLRIEDDHNRNIRQLQIEKNREIANAKEIDDLIKQQKRIDAINALYDEKYLTLIDKKFDITIDGNKAEGKAAEDNVDEQLKAFSALAHSLSALAAENKQLAAAGAIIDTYAGATAALKDGTPLGFVQAAAIIAAGLANVRKIFETPLPGGAGGSGGGGGITAPANVAPAPQMMGGSFELTNAEKPEPVEAYVVSDNITNNQNKLANIRRRATI